MISNLVLPCLLILVMSFDTSFRLSNLDDYHMWTLEIHIFELSLPQDGVRSACTIQTPFQYVYSYFKSGKYLICHKFYVICMPIYYFKKIIQCVWILEKGLEYLYKNKIPFQIKVFKVVFKAILGKNCEANCFVFMAILSLIIPYT